MHDWDSERQGAGSFVSRGADPPRLAPGAGQRSRVDAHAPLHDAVPLLREVGFEQRPQALRLGGLACHQVHVLDGIHAADLGDDQAATLRAGSAENLKRVRVRTLGSDDAWLADDCESPWWIEPFLEMKTIWHPSGV